MGTTNTNFVPNATGLDLGSPDQRWDGFFQNILVAGSINTGPQTSDSVQVLSTTQAVGFAGAVHTMILATSGGAGITLTLPTATAYAGQVIKVKKVDAGVGAVTITGSIDGLSSYPLTNQYQYVCLESGNGTWQVVGNN